MRRRLRLQIRAGKTLYDEVCAEAGEAFNEPPIPRRPGDLRAVRGGEAGCLVEGLVDAWVVA